MTSRKTFEGPYFKSLDDDLGTFEAVVSVFGNVDYQGDRVMPGAFEEHLKELRAKGAKLPVVWSHDWGNPFAHIGYVDPQEALEITSETAKSKGYGNILGGLYVKGKLDIDKEFARQVYDLLKDGRVREWSFAYDVVDEKTAKDGANELNVLNVWEVGPTLKGANQATTTIAVKSIKQQLEVAHEIDMGAAMLSKAVELSPEVGVKMLTDFTAKQRERLNGEKAEDEAEVDKTTEEIADTFKAVSVDDPGSTGEGSSPWPTGSALSAHILDEHNSYTSEEAVAAMTEAEKEEYHHARHQGLIVTHVHTSSTTPGEGVTDTYTEKSAEAQEFIYFADEKADFKPWHIAKQGGKYCVIKDSDGTTEKCHDTREEAVAHMRALYANEPKAQDIIITPTPNGFVPGVIVGADGVTYNITASTTTNGNANVDTNKAGRRISKDSEQAIRDAILSLQSLLELPDEETPKSDEPETPSEDPAQKAASDEIAHYKAIIDSLKMDETS